jgi:2-polyprenyl-6-methoxyphenol hydroxylase-like FAD-dependent oxidoreductase
MFDLIKHWPIVRRLWPIVRHTPRDKFINYPLFDHSPLSRWVSTGGRVILIGDAAHPLSPAAGQGASQGIEDANVVALCLQLAGKTQVPLGLRVAERLRYPRAAVVQLVSQAANESWQQHPWDNYENGQETIASLPLQDWIFKHDSQSHTFAEFEVVAESLRRGQAYVPSNVPVALLKHLRSKEALPRASRM